MDRTSSFISLPADSPGLCAQVESAVPKSGLWMPMKFSDSEFIIQTADEQHKVRYPGRLTSDANYCLRLMWNSASAIPIKPDNSYRIKYCHTGNPSKCSGFVYPTNGESELFPDVGWNISGTTKFMVFINVTICKSSLSEREWCQNILKIVYVKLLILLICTVIPLSHIQHAFW